MTEDTIGGNVVSFAQLFDQFEQGGFLLRGAGVLGRFSIGSATAYIANSDAIGIPTDRMSARLANITPRMNRAITVNYPMITNIIKPPLQVPTPNVGNGEILTLWGGGAMNDNLRYFTLVLDASRHAQSRPSLAADNSIGFKITRRLEVFNSFIGQLAKYAVNSEVEPPLQLFHALPARA